MQILYLEFRIHSKFAFRMLKQIIRYNVMLSDISGYQHVWNESPRYQMNLNDETKRRGPLPVRNSPMGEDICFRKNMRN